MHKQYKYVTIFYLKLKDVTLNTKRIQLFTIYLF